MSTLNNLVVILLVSVSAVVARPTETSESVDGRQGYNLSNQGQQISGGFPGSAPGYPIGASFPTIPNVAPGSYPAGNSNTPLGPIAPFPAVPVASSASYPAGSNTRPAYGYDNAFPDQVNFSGADPNRNVAASVSAPIHNQASGLIPPNLSGISTSAFSSVFSNFKV
ncbi:uncharacterized protein LOC123466522 [Daphnia magna]|uniref:Uncharacterized protein n=1 Tax=Daphnia magna TaxID=35525 RepID=A0A164Z8U3_9CRUS|nr:uncharacterized protein LOC123466522 [Daphnia magna]KZS16090.1 Uncharacterized protein APZ42_018200 [Daphnia magna]